jgi:hypothetical protein
MRHVALCDVADEPDIMAAAIRSDARFSDRIVILSPRRGPPFETSGILNIPMQFALEDTASPYWRQKHGMRKAIALGAGLQSARLFGGVEDVLMNIEACDPDVIHLRNMGSFGEWLEQKCSRCFPGRRVFSCPGTYDHDENDARWRSYDPTSLVSIVVPVYNGERYLHLSIESCLAQTHENFELVIVDDDSTDNTPAIIRSYAAIDHRIRHISSATNLGPPESLNVGFRFAEGCFLTWTSDDNLYAPTALEYMVQQLCTFTKVGLVYCGAHYIDEASNRSTPIHMQLQFPPTALARRYVVGACFLYRREVMDVVRPYRPVYRYVEDWDFFIRACIKFPARFYFEPFYFYRKHSGSLSGAHSNKWKPLGKKLRREHFGSGQNRIMLPTVDQRTPNIFLDTRDRKAKPQSIGP